MEKRLLMLILVLTILCPAGVGSQTKAGAVILDLEGSFGAYDNSAYADLLKLMIEFTELSVQSKDQIENAPSPPRHGSSGFLGQPPELLQPTLATSMDRETATSV